MTLAPPTPTGPPTKIDQARPREVLRRHRRSLVVAGVLLAALIAVAWINRADGTHPGVLDPQNPKPEGARALAQVLKNQGIDVTVARTLDELHAVTVGPDTTVFATGGSTGELDDIEDTDELLTLDRAGGILLPVTSRGLAEHLGLELVQRPTGERAASCDTDRLSGLAIDTRVPDAFASRGCFGSSLVDAPAASQVQAISAVDIFSNDRIREADNAAVALRLLGQRRHLVWYAPDPALEGGPGPLADQIPDWFLPSLLVIGLSAGWFLLWRGRRFGPLVRESIPVEIRADETAVGRGRLYHATGDTEHAAQILRTATRNRLAQAAAIPDTASLQHLAGALHAQHGIDPSRVIALLSPPSPVAHPTPRMSEADLTTWSRHLLELEAEVRTR